MATPASRDHGLDGLRGIAALLVFFSHVGLMTWWPGGNVGAPSSREYALWHLGAPAVDLFFVLSGYVLAASLESVRIDVRTIGAFCARRWARLMPIALSGTILGLIVKTWIVPLRTTPLVGMVEMNLPLGWQDYVGMLTFSIPIPNTERFNIPLWSLVIEMYASLLIPFVIAGIRAQGRFFLIPALLVPVIPWQLTGNLQFMTMPLFVLGIAIRTYLPPIPRVNAFPLLTMGMVLLFSRHIFGEFDFWHRYVSGLGAAFVIVSVHAGAIRRFLTSSLSSWLGRISYPFYALHFPLLLASTILLGSEGVQTNLAALASLPIALLVADLAYRLIERPSIRLSRRVGADILVPAPEKALG